jgi:RND superfamily putative drug exporter
MRFARLGQALVRYRRWVVILAALFIVGAGAYGGDVASKLSTGGFEDPAAESTRADALLRDEFASGQPNVVLLVTPASGATVDDPAIVAAGEALTAELAAHPGMGQVASYWSLGRVPPLRGAESDSALVFGRIDGTEDEIHEQVTEISESFNRSDPGAPVAVRVGGLAEAYRQIGATTENDLRLAEMIALPLTLLLLLFVFRSVVAASLPLAVGVFAIVGTFTVLKVLAGITDVSIFALNLTTALGLGLAIDYSLFVVSRYREERALGHDTNTAVVRTVATAGRAVFLSGLTVAASLAALLVFPLAFLRSFAYAGIPVVAMALVGAVVVLPAILAMLGDRVDTWSLPRRRSDGPVETTFWFTVATAVMRRPVAVAGVVIAFLLLLGLPFLRFDAGLPDDRVMPTTLSSRQVGDTLREDYSSKDTAALAVVLPDAEATGELGAYGASISKLEGVARVDSAAGIYLDGTLVPVDPSVTARFVSDAGQWLSVVPDVDPASEAGQQLVADIRAVPAPSAALVAGQSAQLVDTKAAVSARLPLALAIIALATFALLFLSFGSVLVPVKALILNLLSLTATFGAMVWIFQDGHLDEALGFTATGVIDLTTPILMFCIAFGLSMDYEVFLLSRIKEEYDRTGDNERAVAIGLARTGRIITAAAAIIAVVFLSFATSSISFLKLFGIGLTLAVVMDATLVRATLVPAFMRLAGDANWWAPSWMRRIYDRAGMSEAAAEAAIVDLRPAAPATSGSGSDHGDDPGRAEPFAGVLVGGAEPRDRSGSPP